MLVVGAMSFTHIVYVYFRCFCGILEVNNLRSFERSELERKSCLCKTTLSEIIRAERQNR